MREISIRKSLIEYQHKRATHLIQNHLRENDRVIGEGVQNSQQRNSFNTENGLLCPDMRQPLRSQSFKHRPRQPVEVKRSVIEDVPGERRKSTPTISRRCSLQRGRVQERTDVWPEPKIMSEVEERFLKLPDSSDFTRVRQFKIDEKGAVVARGDSFRRRKPNLPASKGDKSPSPYTMSGADSCSDSLGSSDESRRGTVPALAAEVTDAIRNEGGTTKGTMHLHKVYIVGDTGTGKTSLINQFSTSEHRNAFADEIEHLENSVCLNIGGEECELIFLESDMRDPLFIDDTVHAFLFLYSIDSKSSFKQALNGMEMVRKRETCRNIPLIVAGNKIDLERKRAVLKAEVRAAKAAFGFIDYEISVALNHDVDDLLIGLLAEIKEAFGERKRIEFQEPEPRVKERSNDDFNAAIRRYSQRKKKQVGDVDSNSLKCSSLSPSNVFHRIREWRRGSIPRLTDS